MSLSFIHPARVGLCVLAATLLLACQGPPGPPGPAGPPGTSSGGAPYVWICTPAFYPNSGGNPRADIYVFNGSSTSANIAVHVLDKDGANLSGITIPGTSPASNYPGQTGSATESLAPSHTKVVTWQMPQEGTPSITNVAASVRVISDQPVVVGSDFQFSGFKALPCSLLPK